MGDSSKYPGLSQEPDRSDRARSSSDLECETARDGDRVLPRPASSRASPADSVAVDSPLSVVSGADDAELETDSSAVSVYEYLSDEDVELVGEASHFQTVNAAPRPVLESTVAQKRGFAADERLGMEIAGRYTLERLIGKGGMGRVYLAKQQPLNRLIAIKILNRSFQKKDPQFPERFYLEAATTARLNHPNTITVFDYGECETGELFIAMEYLKGKTLSRLVSSGGAFSSARTIRVGMQIARALRAAHKHGIIHRDLKPGNIMLLDGGDDPDMAKVLDFGLVKLFQNPDSEDDNDPLTPDPLQSNDLTHAGMFLGSPKYMSPEQIQGHDLDPRTDIYSLGVLLFYMLTGRQPFIGKGSIDIVYQHIHGEVPYFNDINVALDIPDELEALVRRCLEKNREHRFASMTEVFDSLRRIQAHLSDESIPSYLSDSAELSRDAMKSALQSSAQATRQSVSSAKTTQSGRPHAASLSTITARLSSLRFALIVAGVVFASGVTAYQWSQPDQAKNNIAKASSTKVPSSSEIVITFISKPSGAEVRRDGALLGITPFIYAMPVEGSEDFQQTFVLSKENHREEVIQREFRSGPIEVYTRLDRIEVKKAVIRRAKKSKARKKVRRTKTRKKDEDYKDNPY